MNKLNSSNPSPAEPIKSQLQVNYCLECLHENKFYVARVVEIIAEVYLKLELDSAELDANKKSIVVNSLHCLFPCKWCSQNNLSLERPSGWGVEKVFSWDEYVDGLRSSSPNEHIHLTQLSDLHMFNWSRGLTALSEEFQLGAYLECVDSKFG